MVMKLVLGFVVAVLVALGAGWALGASGKSEMTGAIQTAELQTVLLEARSAVLDARLDIYNVNFGEASRHFELARTSLRSADERLKALGRLEDSKRLTLALSRIDEAQQMAGQLNQAANAVAADAANVIHDVIGNTATR
jgi:hypothetical protein